MVQWATAFQNCKDVVILNEAESRLIFAKFWVYGEIFSLRKDDFLMNIIEELKNITIPVFGTVDESVVDGEGMRFALFVQGCPHHCNGCHNPKSWATTTDNMVSLYQIYQAVEDNPLLSGITFSGGEPFLYARQLAVLAKAIHASGKDVWSFSGWTYEQLMKRGDDARELLANIDVLVDGPFQLDKRDLSLQFRGSWNQRVIDMVETRRTGLVVERYVDSRRLLAA